MAAQLAVGDATAGLQAEAFKKLYPEHYVSRFIQEGIRPDGRALGRARATTIGLHAVGPADGSALVKVGSTTVLAGVRLELGRPAEGQRDVGSLSFNVEAAAFSSADYRPGRQPEYISSISERLQAVVIGCGLLPLQQLCVAEGKCCWNATVDVYVLDADGSVFDAALLAVTCALTDCIIPAVTITKEGQAHRSKAGETPSSAEARMQLTASPVSLTCCLYQDQLLADPTAEEEGVAAGMLVVVIDEHGKLYGLHKYGGATLAPPSLISKCYETARIRYKEVAELIAQARS